MYPQRELIRLGVHKAFVRRRITRHRADCVAAAARVVRPLEWLDRALALLRRLSPLALAAAVPLGFFLIKRATSRRRRLWRSFVRWAPLVFGAVRGVSAAFQARATPSES
jgi:hypothetical protein